MKFITTLSLLLSLSAIAETKRGTPVNKEVQEAKNEVMLTGKAMTGKAAPKKKEEDCDEKAKKPIEIKEETITLGGNTGCTLE